MYPLLSSVPAPALAWGDAEAPSAVRQLTLLAPTPDVFPRHFERVGVDGSLYAELLGRMQRLRGAVYLEDEAIRPSDLDETGRHVMDVDAESFHLLALSQSGHILGCCRFKPHRPNITFDALSVSKAAISHDPILGTPFRESVSQHLQSAQQRGLLYVEVGGWAIHPSIRHSTEAIRIALLNFSLGLSLGGAVGICTATTRNHSASILRRMGGRPLAFQGFSIPQYFDPRYGCDIEVMTFDSQMVPDRYAGRIDHLQQQLLRTPVVCYQPSMAPTYGVRQ